ncbi:serine/threonine protein kinase [Peribacillus sp. SCS-37]|uniref:serine/threonine protein kinase n=1 Tax=Paraperibacillus esterisolvens TaxID=3115296 RepID=UPI003905DC26
MNAYQRFRGVLPEYIAERGFLKELEKGYSWRVLGAAGTGSYGKAYLVQDRATQNIFILKRLRKRKWGKKTALQAFLEEQELLKKLQHPSFPEYIEGGCINGIPYFIMERKAGRTIEELLFEDGMAFTEKEAFQLGTELLALIVCLHACGISHRDIRLPNILLDQGRISIIDFGLACSLEVQEERKGHPRDYTNHLSDLYLLGHFILFLLYANFAPSGTFGSKSWEEELELTEKSRMIIKTLLLAEGEYPSARSALEEIQLHIKETWGEEHGVF